SERARPDNAQIVVAHHDGIGRSPFVAGEQTRRHVVDVRFERRIEAVLPRLQFGQDRNVVGGERMLSRTISCAPFLIALSSSGNRYDSVSRESSVHSTTSISSPLMKSIRPIAHTSKGQGKRDKGEGKKKAL